MKMTNARRSINFDLDFYKLMAQVADTYKQQHKRFISVAEVIYRLIDQDTVICSIYNSIKAQYTI